MQIAVHWSVVLLLIGQWYTSDAIPRTHNPLLPPSESDLFQHAILNYAGLLIGALVLIKYLKGRRVQIEDVVLTDNDRKKVAALLDEKEITANVSEVEANNESLTQNFINKEQQNTSEVSTEEDKGKKI